MPQQASENSFGSVVGPAGQRKGARVGIPASDRAGHVLNPPKPFGKRLLMRPLAPRIGLLHSLSPPGRPQATWEAHDSGRRRGGVPSSEAVPEQAMSGGQCLPQGCFPVSRFRCARGQQVGAEFGRDLVNRTDLV